MPYSPEANRMKGADQRPEVSGSIERPKPAKEAPKASKEDMETDLRGLYRRIGEINMKIDEIDAQMEDLRKPKGADKYASPETTVQLLNKMQEEKKFHETKRANAERLISDLEGKLNRPN